MVVGEGVFCDAECILATRVEEQREDDKEMEGEEREERENNEGKEVHNNARPLADSENASRPEEPQATSPTTTSTVGRDSDSASEGNESIGPWYDDRLPPLALWVCGSDDLVDGKRFLKRLEKAGSHM